MDNIIVLSDALGVRFQSRAGPRLRAAVSQCRHDSRGDENANRSCDDLQLFRVGTVLTDKHWPRSERCGNPSGARTLVFSEVFDLARTLLT